MLIIIVIFVKLKDQAMNQKIAPHFNNKLNLNNNKLSLNNN